MLESVRMGDSFMVARLEINVGPWKIEYRAMNVEEKPKDDSVDEHI